MSFLDWLATWLTRGYARTVDLSGVSDEEIYRAQGEERKVFWVNTDNWPMAGQCTPFGTILLNEDRLTEVPDDVVDYVFLHEIGHSEAPTLLSLGGLVIRPPLFFLALLGIPMLAIYWLAFAASGPTLEQLLTFSAAYALVALFLIVPLVVIWRLDEGYAELFVVSKIGADEYLRRHEQMNEHSDRGLFGRVFRWLFYPRPNHVVRVANRLEG